MGKESGNNSKWKLGNNSKVAKEIAKELQNDVAKADKEVQKGDKPKKSTPKDGKGNDGFEKKMLAQRKKKKPETMNPNLKAAIEEVKKDYNEKSKKKDGKIQKEVHEMLAKKNKASCTTVKAKGQKKTKKKKQKKENKKKKKKKTKKKKKQKKDEKKRKLEHGGKQKDAYEEEQT